MTESPRTLQGLIQDVNGSLGPGPNHFIDEGRTMKLERHHIEAKGP